MERLTFEYAATKSVPKRAYVGVVGSGDLEVLLEPLEDKKAYVTVRTRFDGFEQIWKDILDRFFENNDIAAKIEINDFGATPGMVSMRLLQALEVSQDDKTQR
ncbi:malonate decarboxylase subunit delta [Anaeromicropila herbilytica]|uniref:Malonate decarboxylase acyl carrier protein n=1 Tax=Anaeromicropila herbilytica TaxID=2785025 RepID=A0A7R7EPG0_9FIRM|nr:malonate decarboxylase subunit delta [Anaeromicropila herbilytica]BCN32665.1 malonate decarboxylase acyl carrier protein [Anaeromicropila herbilytica]